MCPLYRESIKTGSTVNTNGGASHLSSLLIHLSSLPHHIQFPVVAMNSCCPIRDPFTGSSNGHIDVKLTMGTPTDIPVGDIQYYIACQ